MAGCLLGSSHNYCWSLFASASRWQEEDDLFDEDLPVEPLEAYPAATACPLCPSVVWKAPDEGPDVFEGEAEPCSAVGAASRDLRDLEALQSDVELSQLRAALLPDFDNLMTPAAVRS